MRPATERGPRGGGLEGGARRHQGRVRELRDPAPFLSEEPQIRGLMLVLRLWARVYRVFGGPERNRALRVLRSENFGAGAPWHGRASGQVCVR